MKQSVAVILVKPDGSVLAQLRDDNPNINNPNTWGTIGGGHEPEDPDLKTVAARELFEETGYLIDIRALRFLAQREITFPNGFQARNTFLWAPYDGTQEIGCNEGQEIRFISPSEFKELKFAPGHEEFLRKASEKPFYRGIERR